MRKNDKFFLSRFDHLDDKPENIYICDEDVNLFEEMKGNYESEAERLFFENLQFKEYHQFAPIGDLLIDEDENTDRIYWVRRYDFEHEAGWYDEDSKKWHKSHFDSLYELLHVNIMKEFRFRENVTFWEWLRRQDYQCINYNRIWEE